MILLGSIQRAELINLIEKQTGRERRLQVAAKKQNEARIRLYDEMTATLRLDPAPTSRVSLALPSPGPSRATAAGFVDVVEQVMAAPPQRRPSRFEVVKAPEVFVTDTDAVAPESEMQIQPFDQQQQQFSAQLSPGAISQMAEGDDVILAAVFYWKIETC